MHIFFKYKNNSLFSSAVHLKVPFKPYISECLVPYLCIHQGSKSQFHKLPLLLLTLNIKVRSDAFT